MGKVTINGPKTPVTKGSNGVAAATTPNVCKMPGPPAPFVPTPLPNVGRSGLSPKGYSKAVKINGQPVALEGTTFGSQGDIASKGTSGVIAVAGVYVAALWLIPRTAFAHCPDCWVQASGIVVSICVAVATASAWLLLRRSEGRLSLGTTVKHFFLTLFCGLLLGIFAIPVVYFIIE